MKSFASYILLDFKYNFFMKEWLRSGYPTGGSITGPSPVPRSVINNNLAFEKQLKELVDSGLLYNAYLRPYTEKIRSFTTVYGNNTIAYGFHIWPYFVVYGHGHIRS
jgi:hypothetical protein